jgi:hypothetical protein
MPSARGGGLLFPALVRAIDKAAAAAGDDKGCSELGRPFTNLPPFVSAFRMSVSLKRTFADGDSTPRGKRRKQIQIPLHALIPSSTLASAPVMLDTRPTSRSVADLRGLTLLVEASAHKSAQSMSAALRK